MEYERASCCLPSLSWRLAVAVIMTVRVDILPVPSSLASNMIEYLSCPHDIYRRIGIFSLRSTKTQRQRFQTGSRERTRQDRHIFDGCEKRIVNIV